MNASLQILVADGRFEINGQAIGVTPLQEDLRAAMEQNPTREIEKHGEFAGVKFERRIVLYDDLGLSFCYDIRDGKVIWLVADFHKADWRRSTESDLLSNFEGNIRILGGTDLMSRDSTETAGRGDAMSSAASFLHASRFV